MSSHYTPEANVRFSSRCLVLGGAVSIRRASRRQPGEEGIFEDHLKTLIIGHFGIITHDNHVQICKG